jgi:hypothetical protein
MGSGGRLVGQSFVVDCENSWLMLKLLGLLEENETIRVAGKTLVDGAK